MVKEFAESSAVVKNDNVVSARLLLSLFQTLVIEGLLPFYANFKVVHILDRRVDQHVNCSSQYFSWVVDWLFGLNI